MNQLWTFWQSTGMYQLSLDQLIMILIGLLLLYLAIIKQFEPLLLIPIGFGGILSNIPGVDIAVGNGVLAQFSSMGLDTGIFPLLVFMGIGAMTDFGPLLANPKTMLLGAAAQFGDDFGPMTLFTGERTSDPYYCWVVFEPIGSVVSRGRRTKLQSGHCVAFSPPGM